VQIDADLAEQGEGSICMDAGTDHRGEGCMLWTLQLKDGRSYLWNVAYPHATMNADRLIQLTNEWVMTHGGFSKIHIIWADRISYHKLAYKTLRTIAPRVLCMIDPCHCWDGLLETALSGFELLLQVVSAIKAAFRSKYSYYVGEWVTYCEVECSVYGELPPSGSNTRAWAGDRQVIEWIFRVWPQLLSFLEKRNVLDQLTTRMSSTVEAEAHHLKGAQQLARLFETDSKVIFVQIVYALGLTDSIVYGLMRCQSRRDASITFVHPLYNLLVNRFVNTTAHAINTECGAFEKLTDDLDPLLLSAYKELPQSSDRKLVKQGVIKSFAATRQLLESNWGAVITTVVRSQTLDSNGDSLTVEEIGLELKGNEGNCFDMQAHSFFLIASCCDPKVFKGHGMPISLPVIEKGVIWKLKGDATHQVLHGEFSTFLESIVLAKVSYLVLFSFCVFWLHAHARINIPPYPTASSKD